MTLPNAFVSVVLKFSTESTLSLTISPGHGVCECLCTFKWMRMGFIEVWNGKQTSRDSSRGDYIYGTAGTVQMCAVPLSLLGSLLPVQRSLKPEGLLHMASLNSQPSPSSMKLSFFLLWTDWYSGMSMIRPLVYKNIRGLFVFYCAKKADEIPRSTPTETIKLWLQDRCYQSNSIK